MQGPHRPGQDLWADFVREQTPRLVRAVADARLRPDQVEEVVQEVWLRVIQYRDRFQGDDAAQDLRRWMIRVARSKKVDLLRRLRRHPVQSLDNLSAEPIARQEGEQRSIEEEEQKRELFRGWLEELREKDAVNYLLLYGHYVEGRTVVELAAETGMTVRAAYCRLNRQVKKYRMGTMLQRDWPTAST